MKYLILLIWLISATAQAYTRNNRPIIINTPGGSVYMNNPLTKPKEELKGVGQEFVGRAKINDGKVSVFIRGCQNVELGDLNKEDLSKEEKQKLQSVKANDVVKLKMAKYGSCEVKEWKKN